MPEQYVPSQDEIIMTFCSQVMKFEYSLLDFCNWKRPSQTLDIRKEHRVLDVGVWLEVFQSLRIFLRSPILETHRRQTAMLFTPSWLIALLNRSLRIFQTVWTAFYLVLLSGISNFLPWSWSRIGWELPWFLYIAKIMSGLASCSDSCLLKDPMEGPPCHCH